MAQRETYGWLDVDVIAEKLNGTHPKVDPLSLRFTQLRGLVESLAGFKPDPAHPVNEKILESIQMAWHEEMQDQVADEDAD